MSSATTTPSLGSYLMPAFDHATVADAMHPGIVSCEPDATLAETARIMAAHRVHCLAVIGISHQQPECGVWSILSDVEVLQAAIQDAGQATARSMATGLLLTVSSAMPLRDAATAMLAAGVSHAVVVGPDTERPIGVLSTLDIAAVLASGEA